MFIRFTKKSTPKTLEITDKKFYENRRQFLKTAAFASIGTIAATGLNSFAGPAFASQDQMRGAKLANIVPSKWNDALVGEERTGYNSITRYNNFYEFGTGKTDPQLYARDFEPTPWKIKVDGLTDKPGDYDLDDLIKPHQLEERVYRHRCVEAWSMVVPWVGVSLADVIKRLEPKNTAKYVAFETLYDPDRMPGQRRRVLQWPYVEGLRMDEAMNELSLLATGLYGEEMPNQNGAPIRLVTPWKYGFKGIKSIVRITFTDKEPPTSWNRSSPREYGFYSNVNPEVDHPRWSQAKERRIGDFLKRKTKMFNGYEEEVAGLYAGMDLSKSY